MDNVLKKLFYKFFNKSSYLTLKNKNRTEKNLKYYNEKIYGQITNIQKKIENNKILTFLHSGQLGDLIYSLASIKEIAKTHKCKLYLQINKPIPEDYVVDSKKVYISKRSADLILPLLREQNFLETVDIYNNEEIDVNLDLFRDIPINLSFYSTRWFSHLLGININVNDTFLSVKPHKLIKNKIIIHRSPRYRNAFINYKFLNTSEDLLCIGLEHEFQALREEIKNLEFYDCKNFLEMAEIIQASKFYIGNMSMQYIIAEALKAPRLLEASPDFPIVFPVGENSFDAYHQNHFENFFNKLNKI
ncbi:hypothetical protein N9T85_00035 [bacterium]|nr:hypothetical protein [bacterium]